MKCNSRKCSMRPHTVMTNRRDVHVLIVGINISGETFIFVGGGGGWNILKYFWPESM